MGFWFLAGPASLLATLFVACSFSCFALFLSAIAVLTLFLCYFFPKRGWLFAAIAVGLFFATACSIHVPKGLYLELGIALSLLMSIFIYQKAFSYLQEHILGIDLSRKELLEKMAFMEETFKKEEELQVTKEQKLQAEIVETDQLIEEKDKELLEISAKKDLLQKELEERQKRWVDEKKKLLQEQETIKLEKASLEKKLETTTEEKNSKLQLLENEKKDLFLKLEKVALEKEKGQKELLQLENEKELLNKELLEARAEQEGFASKKEEIIALEASLKEKESLAIEKILSVKETIDLYNQLKMQFKVKNDILHETRDRLFHMEEESLAKQREEELLLQENSSFDKDLLYYEKELDHAEVEIEALNDLVTHLLQDAKPIKKRERKKKISEEELPLSLS